MSWPSSLDYQTAVQNPKLCFVDQELRFGVPETDRIGLPKPISGNFAVVFPIVCGKEKWAVRCFVRHQVDREQRYEAISSYLNNTKLPCMVNFEFVRRGIRVSQQWFPIVKMKWVNGDLLDTYIERNLHDRKALRNLADEFLAMMSILRRHKIAHGDLQHRNIMVVNGEISLVDYDGMFVPGLERMQACELGHTNYQSPLRNEVHYGPYLDNFSAWVIYLSLVALSIDPNLWRPDADDECLILRKDDFQSPEFSRTVDSLEGIKDNDLQRILRILKFISRIDLSDIPFLDPSISPPREPPRLPPIGEPWLEELIIPKRAAKQQSGRTDASTALPVWLQDYVKPPAPRPEVGISKPLITERIMLAFCLALLCLTAWFDVSGLISLGMVLLSWIGLTTLYLGFLVLRLISLPEVKAKKVIERDLRSVGDELHTAERARTLLDASESSVIENEQRQLAEIVARWHGVNQKAERDVETVGKALETRLGEIGIERQKSNQASEMRQALEKKQVEFLAKRLMQSSISDARITGIGPSLRKQLTAAGLRTAADFTDIAITSSTYYYYQRKIALIVLASGRKVHVPGIGSQKAGALLGWRRGVESSIKKELPSSLSSDEMQTIHSQTRDKLAQLNIQQAKAKQEYDAKEKQIAIQCRQDHLDLKKQMLAAQKSCAVKLQELEPDLKENQRVLGHLNSVQAVTQRELARYGNVNFSKYLKKILHVWT